MAKIHAYTVTGRGQFPMDMLRHDQAWPENDGTALYSSGRDQTGTLVSSTVKMNSIQEPTVARWASFGWYVNL